MFLIDEVVQEVDDVGVVAGSHRFHLHRDSFHVRLAPLCNSGVGDKFSSKGSSGLQLHAGVDFSESSLSESVDQAVAVFKGFRVDNLSGLGSSADISHVE